MFSNLTIEYADPCNLSDSIKFTFQLLNNPVVPLWCQRLIAAQQKYSIDDPRRFYGFGTLEQQQQFAVDTINHHIEVINNFKSVIEKKLNSVHDQETLNYLHWCFETHHGHLDKQDQSLFLSAPKEVKLSLCELNVAVHRCESVANGAKPRHVTTYYSLPKEYKLAKDHYQYFTSLYQFGTVYINYVEIGKTLENLAIDNDQFITAQAFKPFEFYSADFTVLFYNSTQSEVDALKEKMDLFYDNNQQFFIERKFSRQDARLAPGRIPVAKLESKYSESEVLNLVEAHQYIKSVTLH